MKSIRERWLVFLGLVLLLAAGNFVANRTSLTREIFTYGYLALGIAFYFLLERTACVKKFYILGRHDERNPFGRARDDHWRSWLLFVGVSIFFMGYVQLTGQLHSPLICLLYLAALLAGLRFGVLPALTVAFVISVFYVICQALDGSSLAATNSVILGLAVAGLFGVVLNARLQLGFQSISEKVAEMGALMDVSQMLETATNLETSVNLILLNTQKIVKADACAVYLLDPSDWTLRLSAALCEDQRVMLQSTLSVEALEAGDWRLNSEDVLALNHNDHVSIDSSVWPDIDAKEGLFASMIGSEGVLGVIYVSRNRHSVPFSHLEAQALRRFASHVSMPVQKAKYQETLSNLAFRDSMTDLSNFRYFEKRLADDLLRAKRYNQQLTLLLMDIDHFKRFNDVYGHKAGDALLRHFGFVLKGCLRESDLPARYGGEEFIVICPSASPEEALGLANRIRATVEETEFDLGESLLGEKTRVGITISIGVAGYPMHASEAGDLVRQADRALYAAKEQGRNQVVSCYEIPTVEETLAGRTTP
jgi:diguanylate cyclase (GGDEF)-like protein